MLGPRAFGSISVLRGVSWSLNTVPNLPLSLLMCGPLICIGYMRGMETLNPKRLNPKPFEGSIFRDHVAARSFFFAESSSMSWDKFRGFAFSVSG